MRLDQYLSKALGISRMDAKMLIKKRKITVNETVVTSANTIIDDSVDIIKKEEEIITLDKNIYIMLNKPKGYITSTADNSEKTVMELIEHPRKKELFPVGRLDKDTTGLLLITNNGALAHELLAPKKHVSKTYQVRTDKVLSDDDLTKLENGVMLDNVLTKPARIMRDSNENVTYITITEGKYHQVKRMYKSVGLIVIELKRISFGPLVLDESLELGEYRNLLEEEITQLEAVIKH